MVTPAVAPYVPSYATRTPYITSEEFINAPNGVDISQLVPRGTNADNVQALTRVIAAASGWVDALCFQVLAATLDTQVGIYRVRSDGTVWVPCDFTPIVSVNGVSWGLTPSDMTALTDLTGVWIQRKIAILPLLSAASKVYVAMSYVNGYVNTVLAADAAAAASTITVASALGVAPGMTMSLYDAGLTETIVVASNYVMGSTTVPLVAPLAAAHVAGVACSSLPPAVKQACMSLTSALVKTRGAVALTMASVTSQPSTTELIQSGGQADVQVAESLLKPFVRVR